MRKTRNLKINAPLRGNPADTTIPIAVDEDGNPTDIYWRRRVRDAKTDNCVEFADETKGKKKLISQTKEGE